MKELYAAISGALTSMKLAGLSDYGLVSAENLKSMIDVWYAALLEEDVCIQNVIDASNAFARGRAERPGDRANAFPSLGEFISEIKRHQQSAFELIGIQVDENTVVAVQVPRGASIEARRAAFEAKGLKQPEQALSRSGSRTVDEAISEARERIASKKQKGSA